MYCLYLFFTTERKSRSTCQTGIICFDIDSKFLRKIKEAFLLNSSSSPILSLIICYNQPATGISSLFYIMQRQTVESQCKDIRSKMSSMQCTSEHLFQLFLKSCAINCFHCFNLVRKRLEESKVPKVKRQLLIEAHIPLNRDWES